MADGRPACPRAGKSAGWPTLPPAGRSAVPPAALLATVLSGPAAVPFAGPASALGVRCSAGPGSRRAPPPRRQRLRPERPGEQLRHREAFGPGARGAPEETELRRELPQDLQTSAAWGTGGRAAVRSTAHQEEREAPLPGGDGADHGGALGAAPRAVSRVGHLRGGDHRSLRRDQRRASRRIGAEPGRQPGSLSRRRHRRCHRRGLRRRDRLRGRLRCPPRYRLRCRSRCRCCCRCCCWSCGAIRCRRRRRCNRPSCRRCRRCRFRPCLHPWRAGREAPAHRGGGSRCARPGGSLLRYGSPSAHAEQARRPSSSTTSHAGGPPSSQRRYSSMRAWTPSRVRSCMMRLRRALIPWTSLR